MSLFGPPNVEKMKARRNFKGLIKAMGYKKDVSVRNAAVKAMVEIGEPAIDPLIEALKEDKEEVRQAAIESLVKIGEPAIESLITALKQYSVREAAADVLVKIGEPAVEQAVKRLNDDLRGERDDVRGDAVQALIKIGEPAIDSLIAALSDNDLNMRGILVHSIFIMTGNMEVIPHHMDLKTKLTEAIRDKGFNARGAAAGALGQIGDTRAMKPLTAALEDEDILVRWSAAGALFELNDVQALMPLANLKDDDLLVQGSEMLKLIADAGTVKPLIAKLADEDDAVQQAATDVLKKLGWRPG